MRHLGINLTIPIFPKDIIIASLTRIIIPSLLIIFATLRGARNLGLLRSFTRTLSLSPSNYHGRQGITDPSPRHLREHRNSAKHPLQAFPWGPAAAPCRGRFWSTTTSPLSIFSSPTNELSSPTTQREGRFQNPSHPLLGAAVSESPMSLCIYLFIFNIFIGV